MAFCKPSFSGVRYLSVEHKPQRLRQWQGGHLQAKTDTCDNWTPTTDLIRRLRGRNLTDPAVKGKAVTSAPSRCLPCASQVRYSFPRHNHLCQGGQGRSELTDPSEPKSSVVSEKLKTNFFPVTYYVMTCVFLLEFP